MEITAEEAARLATLLEYDILDSEAEEAFDRLAEIATDLFQVPMAAVSLVDGYRQWFKSRVGLPLQETPREFAFCHHAIRGDRVFVVADAARDRRFAANPLVIKEPAIRFYAGAPLLTADGQALGTICVMDRRVRRPLSPREKRMLQKLAAMVMEQIELRRHVNRVRASVQRALRLAGARSPAHAECQKALKALRDLQALAARAGRQRARLITPEPAKPRRRTGSGGGERRAERRGQARK